MATSCSGFLESIPGGKGAAEDPMPRCRSSQFNFKGWVVQLLQDDRCVLWGICCDQALLCVEHQLFSLVQCLDQLLSFTAPTEPGNQEEDNLFFLLFLFSWFSGSSE
jgi:hypothetical protein